MTEESRRPTLHPALPVDQFEDWYWLLDELRAYCRRLGIPSGGAKAEVTVRIAHFLRTGEVDSIPQPTERSAMPTSFDPAVIIQPGWRCSQPLRAYLVGRLGPRFSFTGPVRRFVTDTGVGRPLGDVEQVWRDSLGRRPTSVTDIPPSQELNRFRHAYRQRHPGASAEDALAAWRVWRETPVSQRSSTAPSDCET